MDYLIIFISKLLENTLATLRIILIANGKKFLGAILTLLISIIWIISVSFIVFDFKDYFKIIAFSIGSGIGSYLGNVIEEKIALGYAIISFKTNDYLFFKTKLNNYDTNIFKLKNGYKFEINSKRKEIKKIITTIKDKDQNIKIDVIKIFNC